MSTDRRNSTFRQPGVRKVQRKLPKLTDEQIVEFKEAFKLFDKDNGGSIDVDELKDALEALGPERVELGRGLQLARDTLGGQIHALLDRERGNILLLHADGRLDTLVDGWTGW